MVAKTILVDMITLNHVKINFTFLESLFPLTNIVVFFFKTCKIIVMKLR